MSGSSLNSGESVCFVCLPLLLRFLPQIKIFLSPSENLGGGTLSFRPPSCRRNLRGKHSTPSQLWLRQSWGSWAGWERWERWEGWEGWEGWRRGNKRIKSSQPLWDIGYFSTGHQIAANWGSQAILLINQLNFLLTISPLVRASSYLVAPWGHSQRTHIVERYDELYKIFSLYNLMTFLIWRHWGGQRILLSSQLS